MAKTATCRRCAHGSGHSDRSQMPPSSSSKGGLKPSTRRSTHSCAAVACLGTIECRSARQRMRTARCTPTSAWSSAGIPVPQRTHSSMRRRRGASPCSSATPSISHSRDCSPMPTSPCTSTRSFPTHPFLPCVAPHVFHISPLILFLETEFLRYPLATVRRALAAAAPRLRMLRAALRIAREELVLGFGSTPLNFSAAHGADLVLAATGRLVCVRNPTSLKSCAPKGEATTQRWPGGLDIGRAFGSAYAAHSAAQLARNAFQAAAATPMAIHSQSESQSESESQSSPKVVQSEPISSLSPLV